MSPSLILDLVIVAVLLVFIILGAYRGFVLTLCGLLAVFVAFLGASFVSNALCDPVAEAIRPSIESHIEGALTKAIQQQAGGALAGDVAQAKDLPMNNVLEALKTSGIYKGLVDSFQNAVKSGMASVTGSAAQSLAAYVARELARTVLFVLAFIVILLLWFLLSHALDLVAKLPVLSTANRIGGGAIGAVKGFLILCVAAWALYTVLDLIPADMAAGSYLLPFLLHPTDLLGKLPLGQAQGFPSESVKFI